MVAYYEPLLHRMGPADVASYGERIWTSNAETLGLCAPETLRSIAPERLSFVQLAYDPCVAVSKDI
jgi:hypothetical protein